MEEEVIARKEPKEKGYNHIQEADSILPLA
jgi:hypothetical protein